MSKELLISHISGKPKRCVRLIKKLNQPVYWIFFCQDYIQFLEWKEVLGNNCRLIELNPALSTAGQRLRRPFLRIISELGKDYNSPAWWASRVSERNTAVSFLFLYCCYLQIFQKQIADFSGTLCVVSESWAVLESLSDIAVNQGWQVKWINRPFPGKETFYFLARIKVRLFRLMRKLILAKIFGSDSLVLNSKPGIIIHTYVEENCFGNEGVFHDRYFPGLSDWLKKNGYPVMTIPVLFNLKRSYRQAWKWFRQSRQQFINPYRYYKLSDYFFVLQEALKQVSIPGKKIILEGMDVTSLFKQESRDTAFSTLDTLLYCRLPKRLVEAGLNIGLIITEYENMINEKLLVFGFRKYLPNVKIVGFQHGALYPLLLCNFITEEESTFAPLPDRVVCNGEIFREILVREGLPAERAFVGPALRYTHLWQNQNQTIPNNNSKDILVILPLMMSDAVELLIKIINAFQNQQNLKIVLKPHPMLSLKSLLNTAGIKNLPSNFEFVQGNMNEWIHQSKVVVGISSSAIYEVFTAGIPVISAGRESSFDTNPLGFFEDLNKVFYSSEQIRAETMRLLSLSAEELSKYKQRGKEILRSSFNPVSDKSMRVFVEGFNFA